MKPPTPSRATAPSAGPVPLGASPAAAVVCGIGAWVPPRVVTNAELARRLDTSDDWIRTRTGIRRRHVVAPGVSTGDLALQAGRRALESAGGAPVEAVVLATTTPDRPCPATAPEVASRLGLGGVPAFDVAAVCTGFVYALATASGLIAAGLARRVLVIGADAFSTIVDPHDRTTTAIFGDGAGAVVLRSGDPAEPGALGPFDLGSDGGLADLITVEAGGSRQRSTGRTAPAPDHYFRMDGKSVFRQAVLRMTESAQRVLDRAGLRIDEVDRFVGHQANARLLDAVAARLGLLPEHVVRHIDRVGNTAAASVPLALADAAHRGVVRPGHRVLLTAFGGGLTWGSAVLRWPDCRPVL
ncbi:3-oxoacyl-[acyl-carrier-protein] synthase 3 [Streptomyces spectabilis]|uniref:Beta-ketoacyl-[acyl-carrier-protein] synthase III n=1 Tax=Streptomyces spectabilis TaxID=68270 RepID=A0A7W8ERT1_STRST|nr:3-oxoacyl-[acyl-carrier-protein] synthase-3 [Streptomyces spectabilis]GGV08793.1 3-oxoacyl-[acyl-carrier-protein] synthase 3 [Streptomyces spectabilis]